nr:DUF998 domain-containing protein [Motilibacter deserti]
MLVGGWTLAAARQPSGFDPVRGSISALAGSAATDRWVMTAALAGLGVCHLVTARGLRAAPAGARGVLAVGGAATLAVAALPLPVEGGSPAHAVAAGVAFAALSVWPVCGRPADQRALPLLRAVPAVGAAALLTGLVAWFAVEVAAGGARLGLAERLAAGAQAVWPLLVVLTARGGPRRG